MTFRFTLSHTNPDTGITDTQVIDPPDGWEDSVLKLERDENFHSLVEHFEGEFTFYGTDNDVNGGIDFIREKEQDFGPDATIRILIEIAPDDVTFETVFDGQLDLASKEEMWDNTMQVGIIRDDFWAKFISRLDAPVDLQGKGLDGEDINLYDPVGIKLTSQVLNAMYRAVQDNPIQIFMEGDEAAYPYIQFDIWDVSISEIEEKITLPSAFNPERPVGLFELTYPGDYTFDIELNFGVMFSDPDTMEASIFNIQGSWQFDIFLQFNDQEKIKFNQTNFGPNTEGTFSSYSRFTAAGTWTLEAGTTVRVYAEVNQILFAFPNAFLLLLGNESGELDWNQVTPAQSDHPFEAFASLNTRFNVEAETTFAETVAEGFLIHDIFAMISDRIIGLNDTFFSEYLGGSFTKTRIYPEDGCGWFYVGVKGLQIRLYSLTEKPFFMSFKQAWDGINPILNLGLGYETIDPSAADEPTVADYGSGTNLGSGDNDWALVAHVWSVTIAPFETAKQLGFVIDGGVENATYDIGYNLDFSDTGIIRIALRDVTLSQAVFANVVSVGASNKIGSVSLQPNFTPKYLTFGLGSTGANTFEVNDFTFNVTLPDSGNEIQVIRVEEKEYFYNDDNTSVDFSDVLNITKTYDHEYQFNQVEIGYQKWTVEDVSGLDSPQTKRVYATRFQKIGQKISLLSQWIAASLTIEVTRRRTREKSADYRYDNDTFIIAVNPIPTDVSPETSPDFVDFAPELDENFSSVENLSNSSSRYNLRLTPARNLLRWINFLAGCLQDYLTSVFRFSSGEGNFDMESTMLDSSPDCSDRADNQGEELSEKQNIPVPTDYLFLPEPLNITNLPLEWEDYKQIRNNRNKAIGISQGQSEHTKCLIKSFNYRIVDAQADLVVWPKTKFELRVIETLPDMACAPAEDSGGDTDLFSILLETGDLLITEDNGLVLVED